MKRIVSVCVIVLLLCNTYLYAHTIQNDVTMTTEMEEEITAKKAHRQNKKEEDQAEGQQCLSEVDRDDVTEVDFSWIDYASQDDVQQIGELQGLRRLNITVGDEVTDLSPIGNLAGLESLTLTITSKYTVDLSFMVNLDQLEELIIWVANKETDLSPISSLSNLKKLEMYRCEADMSFIINCNQLTELILEQCEVDDLAFLSGLEHLQYLSAEYVKDVDLNNLSELKALEHIYICGENIRNAEGLSDLVCLQNIDLRDSHYYINEERIPLNLYALSGLTKLQGVLFENISITDIGPLADLKNLQDISLYNTGIEDIKSSEGSASIDQIDIQGRTKEETELIQKILSEDKEEFEEFLTTDWAFPHDQEAVLITAYDFTGDGQ